MPLPGHYVAFVKPNADDGWFLANDDRVVAVSFADIIGRDERVPKGVGVAMAFYDPPDYEGDWTLPDEI